MKFSFRALLALPLVAGGILACTESPPTITRLSPNDAPSPSFARNKATDSLLLVTDIAYSDTSLVLTWLTALPADLSASATIGREGGEIRIDEAGLRMEIPSGALAGPTLITMTVLAGPKVAYHLQPHGLVFARPVKIRQDLQRTSASTNPSLKKGMHGSYYDTSLDSAYIDAGRSYARTKKHQIGYVETSGSHLKFYIGHFSGYMVSCGRDGDRGDR